MDEWFCQIAGREMGPLLSDELKAMAAQGQILPTDNVRRGTTGHWVAASRVRGLFVAGQKPPRAVVEPPSFFGSSAPPAAEVFSHVPEPNVAWPTEPPAAPVAPEAPRPPPPPAPPAGNAMADDSAPFDFLAEPAGHAAAGNAANRRALLARAKRKRQQQILVAGSLIFVIFGLAIAALFLLAGNFSGFTAVEDDVRQAGGLGGLSQKLERVASQNPADESGEKSPLREGPIPPASAKSKKPTDENPAEAAGLHMVVGDVPVRLVSVARGSDAAGTADSQCLLITVEVSNPSARDKLAFAAWSLDAALRGATLTDDRGKIYPAKPVNAAAVLDTPPPSSIAPGKSARDVLCFELPSPKAQSLQLELPCAAFATDASASFQIPVKMIAAKPVAVKLAPKTGSKAKKHSKAKPGTPEYDFGIEEEDDAHR